MELSSLEYHLNHTRESRDKLKAMQTKLYKEMFKLPYGPERDILQERYDVLMQVSVTLILNTTTFEREKARQEKKKSFLKKLFRK